MTGLYALEVVLDLADRMSGPINAPIRKLAELEAATKLADQSLERLQQGFQITAIGAGLTAPMALATAQAIQFEAAFSDVAKVVDFPTPAAPKQLQNDLLDLSSQVPVTAVGLTDIAAAAGAAGIGFSELIGFTEDAAKVAVAFDITASRAGNGLAVLRNVFGLTEDGVNQLTDSVNYLSNSMASEAPDILDVLLRVGATGKVIGMTGQQVAALGSAMLSTGTAPEVVSTGLNALVMRLSTATHQSKDFTTALNGIGMSAPKLEAAIRQDATGTILNFLETVRGSKDSLGTLSELFGAEYADDIAKLVNNVDLVKKGFGLVADPTLYASSVTKEYGVRAATTANQLQLFLNRVQNIGITLGSVFLPPLNAVLGKVGEFLLIVQRFIQQFPLIGGAILGTIGAIGVAIATLGILVMTIGAVGFASAQAKIGLALMAQMFAPVSFAATALVTRLAVARFGIAAVQLAALEGVTPLGMFGGGLMGAARAAGVFAMSLLTNPIFLMIAAVVALGAVFIWAWNEVDGFRANVMTALDPLFAAWHELEASVRTALSSFGQLGQALMPFFSGTMSILDAVAFGIGFFLGFLLTLFVNVFARIARVPIQVFGGIVDVISGAVNMIIGLLTGDMKKAEFGVGLIWDGIFKILTAPLALIGIDWSAVQQGFEDLMSWVGNFISGFFKVGQAIADGVVRGITGKGPEIASAAGGMVTTAEKTTREVGGIRSPSTLFTGLGAFLPLGLALGIISEMPTVNKAVAGMLNVPALEAKANLSVNQPTLPKTLETPLQLQATQSPVISGLQAQPVQQTPLLAPNPNRLETVVQEVAVNAARLNPLESVQQPAVAIPNLSPLEAAQQVTISESRLNPLASVQQPAVNAPDANPLETALKFAPADTRNSVRDELLNRRPRDPQPAQNQPARAGSGRALPPITINFNVPAINGNQAQMLEQLKALIPEAILEALEKAASETGFSLEV